MPDLTAPRSSSDEPRTAHTDLLTDTTDASPTEPVYGARYYATYTGGAYEYDGDWPAFFSGLAERIARRFAPTTVLDVGCAKGFLVHTLRERGIEAYGIDISDHAIANAIEQVRPYLRVASVTEPLDRRYDLVTCIETIEHVPPEQIGAAIANLCAAADVVLLSSTPDGEHYGEPSHTSMRPPEAWAALFAEHGFLRDLDADVDWVTPWAMVFKRAAATSVPEVVRSYDRHLTRLQREASELRRSALAMERELETLHAAASNDEAELRAELDEVTGQLQRLQAREERAVAALTESLRLRDLLIVSERSLGHVRGELALLRDQLAGYDELAANYHAIVNSTTWRLAWKLLGPYRRLRERTGV